MALESVRLFVEKVNFEKENTIYLVFFSLSIFGKNKCRVIG
jgi:hypothetical protein